MRCSTNSLRRSAVSFQFWWTGVNFGSVIKPSGAPISGFTLARSGIYQIHLSGYFSFGGTAPVIQAVLNVGTLAAQWIPVSDFVVVGDRLISAQAGDVLSLVPNVFADVPSGESCELVITLVAYPPPPPPMSGPPVAPATGPSIIQWRRR